MKKNQTGVIVGALIVVLLIVGIAVHSKSKANAGSLYVGVTDASSDINNVNNIDMKVSKVEVHSAAKGWMTVSSDSKTYSLLTLKSTGNIENYGKSDIASGSYDKVRVTLGDTTVHTKSKGDVKAVMPSDSVVMNTAFTVNDNQNTHLKLDFLADKSLHATSDGQYVFAPVINSEARSNATVAVNSDNTETVSGGNVDSTGSVGVDLSGASRSNFELTTDGSLKIGSSKGSNLEFMLGGKSFTSDNSKVEDSTSDSMNESGTLNLKGALNSTSSSNSKMNDSNTNASGTSTNGASTTTNGSNGTSGSSNANGSSGLNLGH